MAYVRVSIVHPLRGHEQQAQDVLHKLVEYYAKQPGYVDGYQLRHVDGSNRLGRIGIWASEADADRAALTEHDIALRAELNGTVDEASHLEFSFDGMPATLTV